MMRREFFFARPVLVWEDTRRDYGDDRFRAIGETDGDILHVAFTWRRCVADHLGAACHPKGSRVMVITKMTPDQIKARPSKRNRGKIAATTDDDIRRQMIEDGQSPDEELAENEIISPWYIRKKLNMSQRQFANTLRVPVATLRNWEHNRVAMEPARTALMRILARQPEAALRALRRRAA
jgi:putative transcriptional regulator